MSINFFFPMLMSPAVRRGLCLVEGEGDALAAGSWVWTILLWGRDQDVL